MCPGAFGGWTKLSQVGFESIGAKSLAAPPASGIRDEFVGTVEDGYGTGIGLEREATAHETRGHTITISIEVQTEVFIDKRLHRVAMIIGNNRQRTQGVGLKPIDGALAGFTVQPLVGDFRQPLPHLAIYVMQISELAQRPETLACIADGPLHFSFFPTGRQVAGLGVKGVFASKGEKAWKEADETAIVLGDRSCQIVIILLPVALCALGRPRAVECGAQA